MGMNDPAINPGVNLATLHAALRNVIVEKRVNISHRHSEGILLTDCTHRGWTNIGNLWAPSEVEVYGSVVFGTPRYSMTRFVQYPIFASNLIKQIKIIGQGGNIAAWWLCVPLSGSFTHATVVASSHAEGNPATTTHGFPVCFRIA